MKHVMLVQRVMTVVTDNATSSMEPCAGELFLFCVPFLACDAPFPAIAVMSTNPVVKTAPLLVMTSFVGWLETFLSTAMRAQCANILTNVCLCVCVCVCFVISRNKITLLDHGIKWLQGLIEPL